MAQTNYTATCHTAGCPNDGVPIVVTYDDLDGELPPQPGVFLCGGCATPITDVEAAS